MSREPNRDLGRETSHDLGRETNRDIGRESFREMGRETSRDNSKYTTTSSSALTGIMTHTSNNLTGFSSLTGIQSTTAKSEPSSVTWAPTPDQKSTEIDRIMAKIEQARLSIANVCVLIRIT